jgi:hypothetical protein
VDTELLRRLYVSFFIEVDSRRISNTGVTTYPNEIYEYQLAA